MSESLADASQPPLLSLHEQRAVLSGLQGIACLVDYHEAQQAGADAQEPGAGKANHRRALELLEMGRAIILEDPDLWTEAEKAAFAPRYGKGTT